MLVTQILRKLKKQQKPHLVEKCLNTYCYLFKPNEARVQQLVHYSSPGTLRAWLEQKGHKLDKSQSKRLFAIIDEYDPNQNITPRKRLKIAVCISGEPRSFIHCIASLKRFFFSHQIDIFIANKSQTPSSALSEQYSATNVLTYKDPDFSELEKAGIRKFGFIRLKHDVTIPVANTNVYPMWYGIQKSFEALISEDTNLEDYDAICRCRFDTFFRKPLDIYKFPENHIFIDGAYNEHNGYSDQFAIGHPKAMSQYFNLYNWFQDSLGYDFGEAGYLPERILKVYLEDKCNFHVTPHAFETRLLRDEYIGLESHQIPTKNNAFNLSRNRAIESYIKQKYPDLYPS